jgi:hypothetical protein
MSAVSRQLGSAPDAGVECPTELRLDFPLPEQTIPSSDSAIIIARFLPSPSFCAAPVQAHIDAIPDNPNQDILEVASGDLRLFSSLGRCQIEWPWSLAGVPSGGYTIVVSGGLGDPDDGCEPVETAVHIVVNRAPVVEGISVVRVQKVAEGLEVTLEANASDAEGNPIAQYLWNPGDGDGSDASWERDGDQYTHTYPTGLSQAKVVVAAYDDPNIGTDLAGATLSLYEDGATVEAKQAGHCGGQLMTIASVYGAGDDNNSNVYCAARNHRFIDGTICARIDPQGLPPAQACPQGQVPFRCQLGALSSAGSIVVAHVLGWSVEMRAKLSSATSNPTACSVGQYARGSSTITVPQVGETAIANPASKAGPLAGCPPCALFSEWGYRLVPNGDRYPSFDASNPRLFGADGDEVILPTLVPFRKRVDNMWSWIDHPWVAARQDIVPAAFTQRSQFVSYVTGDLGTSWCHWALEQQWRNGPGGGVLQTFGGEPARSSVIPVAGWNCKILGTPQERVPLNRMAQRLYGPPMAILAHRATAILGNPAWSAASARAFWGFRLSFRSDSRIDNLGIRYQAHLTDRTQPNGFVVSPWIVEDGCVGCGPADDPRALRGFRIEPTGGAAGNYSVLYKAALAGVGWTPSCRDGAFCGTEGPGDAPGIVAMQAFVTKRNTNVNVTGDTLRTGLPNPVPMVDGLLGEFQSGRPAYEITNFLVDLSPIGPPPNLGLAYRVSWTIPTGTGESPWVYAGTRLSAPLGERLLGASFELTGNDSGNYDVFYEVYNGLTSGSWSKICMNGEFCGQINVNRPIGALRIWIRPR